MRIQASVLLLVAAISGCSDRDTSPSHRSDEAIEPTQAWIEYSDSQGNYRVMIPAEPEFSTYEMPAPSGGTMEFNGIAVHTNNNSKAYFVIYVDYPIEMKPEDDDAAYELMNRYVTGGAKKRNLELQYRSKIETNDFPGEEYLFNEPVHGDKSLWRVYFFENRLYQLISNWAPNLDQSPVEARKFLDSFQLVR